MKILVIQSDIEDPPGHLAEPARETGAELVCLLPVDKGDTIPSGPQDFDGLIILGGFMKADDDEGYPHLKRVADLICRFEVAGKPVLGVCLGAQLIARSRGKPIYAMKETELGVLPVEPTGEAKDDPLLGNITGPVHLLQWHHDSFDLPDGAVLLMRNQTCPVQAFRLDGTTYGFQPHFEAKAEAFAAWIERHRDLVARHHPSFLESYREDIAAREEEGRLFCHSVGRAWFELVRTCRSNQGETATSIMRSPKLNHQGSSR